MTPNSNAPPHGLNVWQIVTSVLSALLIAAIAGLFTMYGKQALLEERLSNMRNDITKLEARADKNAANILANDLKTNERLNTVDALKASFDNLTRYADRDRDRAPIR